MTRDSDARWTAPLLGVCGVVVAASIVLAMSAAPFDHDEVLHAQSAWLVHAGKTPFLDFYSVYPPFPYYVVQHLFSLVSDPLDVMVWLRRSALLGTALQLGALLLWHSVERPAASRAPIVAMFLLLLCAPTARLYAGQFRLDSWAYALAIAGFAILAVRSDRPPLWRTALGAALITVANAWSPKWAVVAVVVVLVDVGRRAYERRPFIGVIAGVGVGVGVGAGVAAGAIVAMGLSPLDVVFLVIDNTRRFAQHIDRWAPFARVLVSEQPLWCAAVVAGTLAMLHTAWRERQLPTNMEIAAVCALGLMLFTSPFPHPQYAGPWLLLASVPAARLLTLRPGAWSRWAPVIAAGGAVALSAWSLRANGPEPTPAGEFGTTWRTLVNLVPPDQSIVAPPPLHPIVRRTPFYLAYRAGSGSDYGPEDVAHERRFAPYDSHMDKAAYLRELELDPPAAIVTAWREGYEKEQSEALLQFMNAVPGRYQQIADGLVVDPTRVRLDGVAAADLATGTDGRVKALPAFQR